MPETNGAGQGEAGPSHAQIRADAGAASKSPANSVTNGATEANGTAKRAAVRKDGQSGNGEGPLYSGSSSSPLHVAPAPMQHEPANSNGSGSKRRRVHDSSPAATSSEASTSRHQSRQPRVRAVHSAGRNDALHSDPLPSGAVMGSMSDRLGSTPPLDAAEREQFAFRATASPSSRILLQAPPSLPYDLSYPPLSPLGTDQAGHSIALRYGHVGLPGSKDARNGAGAGPSSRGLLPGQPGNSHERPKKVLRGEDHERHMVSEAAGPDAMPWGLKTTLIEKSRQLPRGKTRMGTQKRNAPRSVRAAQGSDDRTQTPQPIKIEEDFASEFSSPMLANMELEAQADDAKEVSPPLHGVNIVEDANVDGILDDSKGSDTMDIDESRAAVMTPRRNGNGHQASLSPSGPSTRRQQRRDANAGESLDPQAAAGTRSPSGTSVAAHHADDSVDMDESQVGDLSMDQSQSGPSRRPRAAHKRLTLLGGYYGRGKKQAANGEDSSSPRVSPAPSSLPDKAESTRDESRAVSEASLAEEGTSVLAAVPEETQITSEAVAGPSTPVKASQQPSLSLGLRESATKRSSTKLHHAGTRNDDEEDDNNSYCETCHGTGHFICCDGCPRSFHFACINPPLDIDELPSTFDDEDDQWFCNVCRVGKRPKGKKPKGVWGPLLQRVEDENPTIFSLPQDVRNYFKGVATATDGSYVDSSMLKPVKVNKNGIVDGREDPLRLKDKNGKLVLCYRCGQSALPSSQDTGRDREHLARKDAKELSEMDRAGWRKLIGCDFCSLHWHLDCLDPPLATMPSSTRKWMCPNHIEHVMRPERVPKNVANSQSVHDLPLPSDKSVGRGKHYRTRVLNDGRIDIIPDPMDTYFGGGSSLAGQDGNGHVAPITSIAGSSGSENRGRGLDRGWEEIDIPGAQARAGSGSAASASLAANASHIRFKYRLPEKVIRVDFWSRAELERKLALDEVARLAQERKRASLDLLATIANAETSSEKTAETLRKDKEAKMQLSAQRARELVAQAFGSGARFARPGRPVEAGNADDMQVIAPDVEAIAISALRETYEEGEFEREFFQTEPLPPVRLPPKRKAPREADMAGLDTSADTVLGTNGQSSAEGAAVKVEEPSTAAANDSDKVKDNMLETALDVDADELAQLRALRQLVQYRGADALLDFVLK